MFSSYRHISNCNYYQPLASQALPLKSTLHILISDWLKALIKVQVRLFHTIIEPITTYQKKKKIIEPITSESKLTLIEIIHQERCTFKQPEGIWQVSLLSSIKHPSFFRKIKARINNYWSQPPRPIKTKNTTLEIIQTNKLHKRKKCTQI